jgi:hypothetical protein
MYRAFLHFLLHSSYRTVCSRLRKKRTINSLSLIGGVMRATPFYYTLAVVFFFLQLVAFVTQGGLQISASDGKNQMISGTVVEKNDRNLVLKDGEMSMSVHVSEDSQIAKNTVGAKFQDISVGDRVALYQTVDGKISKVEVTSGELAQMSKWILPFGLLAAATMVMLYATLRRMLLIISQRQTTRQPYIHMPNISAG